MNSQQPAAQRWSSRKFCAAMFWQAVFTVMRWDDVLPVEAYVTLTWLTLGYYFASNLAAKYMEKDT